MASVKFEEVSFKASTLNKEAGNESKTNEKDSIEEGTKSSHVIKMEGISNINNEYIIKVEEQNDNEIEVDKNQEIQITASPSNCKNIKESKDINNEVNKNSLKRKRKNVNIPSIESSFEESSIKSKRKKGKNMSDRFCWRCHKESVDAQCTACPRSWHRKCIGGTLPSFENWICGECATTLRAENAETRSIAMAQLSIDQLCMLLKYVVERLRDYPGSEPFWKPVDLDEVPNYLDYVIKPMDLSLLESNVRAKLYGSTDAFMADAKWIQHNCIVFNTCGGVYTDTSKLTNASKQIIKMARQEVSELEACPECYAHGRNLPRPLPSWFIEPCRQPHLLVWAKLKGFPYWPAKAMPRVNSQGHVDVRFFGAHDRAWVPPKDLYLYSEEPPAPSPRKKRTDMEECVREVTRHCKKLVVMFGQFKFAPPKVQYNPNDPMQIRLMLPNYSPHKLNNHLSSDVSLPKKKVSLKKRSQSFKNKSQNDEAAVNNNDINTDLKANANSDDYKKERSDGNTLNKVQELNLDDIVYISDSSNDNQNKSHKTENKATIEVNQNETIKNQSKIMKTSQTENNDTQNDNTTKSSTIILNENNLQNVKDKVELSPETLSNSVIPPITESSDALRIQKKTVLKSMACKREVTKNLENTSKPITKFMKSNKVYKPKARMVDKLNAERALKIISDSKENGKTSLPNLNNVVNKASLLCNMKESESSRKISENDTAALSSPVVSNVVEVHNKVEAHASSSTNLHTPKVHSDKSVLLFVVNNGKAEAARQSAKISDSQANKNVLTTLQKRESKAKKSFPNKPRNITQVPQYALSNSEESVVSKPAVSKPAVSKPAVSKPETSSSYQLVPPEAGPISARLHYNAQELARRMGQLMEEAYKEAAQSNSNYENRTSDNHQATIYFLRMQMEHMKWQHQQQLAELKHNTDRTLREMRTSLEAEKLRLIEEVRREAEEVKVRCIEETKQKQWCAKCGREALFYCCWNTAYCDYPCQQSHWPSHMRTCSQQPAYTIVTNSDANTNPQQNNNTMVHNPSGRAYLIQPNKLSKAPAWSTSYFANKAD